MGNPDSRISVVCGAISHFSAALSGVEGGPGGRTALTPFGAALVFLYEFRSRSSWKGDEGCRRGEESGVH